MDVKKQSKGGIVGLMCKLKPCPFCGYTATIETFKARKGYESVVSCNRCLANSPTITYDTYEMAERIAIEQWNRRTQNDE